MTRVKQRRAPRRSIGDMELRSLPRASAAQQKAERESKLIAAVLSRLPLFRHVAPENLASVARHSYVLNAMRGEVICARGQPMPGVFALSLGAAKLSLSRPGCEEKVVRFLAPGDSFGEAGALQARPSRVTLAALEDSVFVVMPPLALLSLIERDPQFARNLLRELAGKFFALLDELESSAQMNAIERLARYLAGIAQHAGDGSDEWIARLPTSKSGIAARLGITKETMSRLLRELGLRGLIRVDGRDIRVPDLDALATLAR